jgi:hypothetical protein
MGFYRSNVQSGDSISPAIVWAGVLTRNGSHSETISASKSYLLVMSVNYNSSYSPNLQKIYKVINGTLSLMQGDSALTTLSASLTGTTLKASSTASAGISTTFIALD